jgi:hypothetical protein
MPCLRMSIADDVDGGAGCPRDVTDLSSARRARTNSPLPPQAVMPQVPKPRQGHRRGLRSASLTRLLPACELLRVDCERCQKCASSPNWLVMSGGADGSTPRRGRRSRK